MGQVVWCPITMITWSLPTVCARQGGRSQGRRSWVEGAQRTSPSEEEKVQGQSPASGRAGASSSSGNMATLY